MSAAAAVPVVVAVTVPSVVTVTMEPLAVVEVPSAMVVTVKPKRGRPKKVWSETAVAVGSVATKTAQASDLGTLYVSEGGECVGVGVNGDGMCETGTECVRPCRVCGGRVIAAVSGGGEAR